MNLRKISIIVFVVIILGILLFSQNRNNEGSVNFIGSVNDPRVITLNKVNGKLLKLAPSKQLSDAVNVYTNLPKANVLVAYIDSEKSSFAHAESNDNCLVQLNVNKEGLGSLARSLTVQTGVKLNTKFVSFLNEFEIVHELGHCVHAQSGWDFNSSYFTHEQNNLFKTAFKNTEKTDFVSLYREMYADAYAAHQYLKVHKDSLSVQYIEYMMTLRAANNQMYLRYKKFGKDGYSNSEKNLIKVSPQFTDASHATYPLFYDIFSDIKSFQNYGTVQGALEYASNTFVKMIANSQDLEAIELFKSHNRSFKDTESFIKNNKLTYFKNDNFWISAGRITLKENIYKIS